MSAQDAQRCQKMIKKIGPWAGVRWMRNQGIAFEDAYFVMFGKQPRLV